jgi:hypothetical protein
VDVRFSDHVAKPSLPEALAHVVLLGAAWRVRPCVQLVALLDGRRRLLRYRAYHACPEAELDPPAPRLRRAREYRGGPRWPCQLASPRLSARAQCQHSSDRPVAREEGSTPNLGLGIPEQHRLRRQTASTGPITPGGAPPADNKSSPVDATRFLMLPSARLRSVQKSRSLRPDKQWASRSSATLESWITSHRLVDPLAGS